MKLLGAGIPVLFAGLTLISCQERLKETYMPTDGLLRFTVTDTLQWHQAQVAHSESRAAADSTSKPSAIKVNGTLDETRPMYLRTSVTRGIDAHRIDTAGESQTQTKGAMITQNDAAEFHPNFGVRAFTYTGSSFTPSGTPDFLNNEQVTRTNGVFNTANKFFMPQGKKAYFFAYAPFGAARLTSQVTNGNLTYSYTQSEWYSEQTDIMFAEAMPANSNGSVNLNFAHGLAAVRFIVASDVSACTINYIKINNVNSTGTFTATNDGRNGGSWTGQATPTSFQYNCNKTISGSSTTATPITPEGEAFFMIPQTTPSNAQIEINVTADGRTETLTASIAGTKWSRGNTYTYTLSFSLAPEFTFTVTPSNGTIEGQTVSIDPSAGKFNFQVLSKKENGDRLEYKMQISDNGTSWSEFPGGTSNGWLTNNSKSQATNDNYNYTHAFTALEAFTVTSTKNSELQGLAELENSGSPTDLSSNKETANCYIVSQAGWYCFPMVYGNALNSSKQETSNFSTNKTNYQNAFGNSITSGWITYDLQLQAKNPFTLSARVLWQDVNGLVSDVQAYDGGQIGSGTIPRYIKFRVAKSTIEEGNAVIGAFDGNGVCVWSWHIWVTPTSTTNSTIGIIGPEASSGSFTTRQYLKSPIGTVHDGNMVWKERTKYVRFVPSDPSGTDTYLVDNAITYTLKTKAKSIIYPGRYVTYQWGRKDPVIPMTIDFNDKPRNSPVYPGGGGDRSYLPPSPAEGNISAYIIPTLNGDRFVQPAVLIKNPHKLYWVIDGSYYVSAHWWNSRQSPNTKSESTNATPQKSIYDPAPSGYVVPPARAFEDFARYSGGGYPAGFQQATSNSSGGYGTGMDKASDGDGFIQFNVVNTQYRLPLLGARSVATNHAVNGYKNLICLWTTGCYSNGSRQQANCFATTKSFIDITGASSYDNGGSASVSNFEFNIGTPEQAYPIIPCKQ